jgi:uncharacterized protein (DUF362 family)
LIIFAYQEKTATMKSINRRNFIYSLSALGGAALGFRLWPGIRRGGILHAGTLQSDPDIVSIGAADPMKNMHRLLEPLGGIGRFVKSGQSVGFLVNSPWLHPGYYTHPDIVLSMMKLCREAGAGSIICYKPVREGYWEESRYYEAMEPLIREIRYGEKRQTVKLEGGSYLQSAEVFSLFLETDVFINIPVAKHHNGTLFSGTLKGLMGVSSRETNRYMHSPDGEHTYDKTDHLAGCIADLNLVRQADLSIVDATVCAINNGPRGPGDTVSPQRILAGTDALALDVYSSGLIGMDPEGILTFGKAAALGLGKSRPEDIAVMML